MLPGSIPNYYRLVTTSKIKLTEPEPRSPHCGTCGFVEYAFPKAGAHLGNGMRIDLASWDGADFCGVKGYEFVLLSRHAAELTLAGGLNKHIAFIRPENSGRWDDFDIRKWTAKYYRAYIETFLIRRMVEL